MENLSTFLYHPLLAQIIGFMGTAMVIWGMQQKSYNRVVLGKVSNEFFGGVHYLFLGGYTGMVVNLAGCVTNTVYWHRNRHNKSVLPFQIAFGILFVVLGCLSWHGFISIFVILAKLISSIALGIKNTRVIRILNLLSNPCWLIYNIYMGSLAGIITDALVIATLIAAVVRIDILKK